MKLVDALRIANSPQLGSPFVAFLACGCTPLHLATAVKAQLRLRFPERSVTVDVGVYGDLAGSLTTLDRYVDVVLVALEWSDIDPRLGWRSTSSIPDDNGILEDARRQLERIESAVTRLAARTAIAVSLPSIPLPPLFLAPGGELSSLEARLTELLYRFAASISAPVIRPGARVAIESHDLRSELGTGFPYTFLYADGLAAELVEAALPERAKKGLITDLDGTLWDGVLGDDGLDGISWDLDRKTHFHALYQRVLNSLASSGVLVAVATKNDRALVDRALERPGLVLKESHVFPVEAHWNSKADSVASILSTWNVGADSVVFVDDNPLEIEQVRAAFPEVECLLFRNDDPRFLCELRDMFGRRHVRPEDGLRVQSLRDAHHVRSAAADVASLDVLLAGIDAKLTLRWMRPPWDPRGLELVNKTNQFNLNGVRYTQAEWHVFLSDPMSQAGIVEYEDRFGKLGKVAVLGGREGADGFELSVWVMSCRAFSRRIEYQILKLLLERWGSLSLQMQTTDRNGPIQTFLSDISAVSGFLSLTEFEQRCPRLYHVTEIIDG